MWSAQVVSGLLRSYCKEMNTIELKKVSDFVLNRKIKDQNNLIAIEKQKCPVKFTRAFLFVHQLIV